MPTGVPKNPRIPKIGPQCPPLLRQLIEQEGTRLAAAKLIKAGSSTINSVATGKWPMTDGLEARIKAALKSHGPITADKPTLAEVEIPPWNKKVITLKITRETGKKLTLKKVPVELAELIKRNANVLTKTANAIGYTSWSTIMAAVENGTYEAKFHGLVHRALNGLPIPNRNGGDNTDMDAHQLGLAICVVSLSEYERLEELAQVMGGTAVFRMASGAGTIVIFRIHDRGKRETFKRLGSRDAKKIVCP